MKNLITLIIVVFIINIKLIPQNYYCNCINDDQNIEDFEKKLSGRIYINSFVGHGSQFFNKWTKGYIIMSDGQVIKNKYIRYNRYSDELIWLRNSDYKTAIVDKETVNEFIIYDEENVPYAHFIKARIKNWYQADSTDVFLQVLAEGYVSLYALRTVTVIRNTNEIYNKDEYYLLKKNNFYKIDASRISLLRTLADEEAQVKQILRRNKLKVKFEPQLIEAIELLNKDFKSIE